MNDFNEYLVFAKKMAYEAGKIMKKYFIEDNGASYKYDQTIVTKADTEINNLLIQKVKDRYPTHSVDGAPLGHLPYRRRIFYK